MKQYSKGLKRAEVRYGALYFSRLFQSFRSSYSVGSKAKSKLHAELMTKLFSEKPGSVYRGC